MFVNYKELERRAQARCISSYIYIYMYLYIHVYIYVHIYICQMVGRMADGRRADCGWRTDAVGGSLASTLSLSNMYMYICIYILNLYISANVGGQGLQAPTRAISRDWGVPFLILAAFLMIKRSGGVL